MVATTCIFLASKVEDTYKKLRDVIGISYRLQHKKDIDPEGKAFADYKENVLKIERLLLQTLNFDLVIQHPYKYIVPFIKKIESLSNIKGTKQFVQSSWNFTNDSFRTRLCLIYTPQKIAASAIFLSFVYLGIQPPKEPKSIFEILETSKKECEDIYNQILDLLEGEHAQKMRKNLEDIEDKEKKQPKFTPFLKKE